MASSSGAVRRLCGWTAHDYLHHGVLKNGQKQLVFWNNAIGFFFGMWQGFTPGWWRARHNTHHVCTNEEGNDPDIKTAPLLTYISNSLDPERAASSLNSVQRAQSSYFLPSMALLDFYWRLESLAFVLPKLTQTRRYVRTYPWI